tara:strand:- start:27 stop:293 length:267 start_codon:yes stop_codon:yes gene_type:complete
MYKVNGVYYDREQFPRVFDSVANPTDWRAEISAWIKPEDYSLINEAVRYFTGTSLEIKEKCKTDHPAARVGHTMLVYSIGYRNGPCGP